jgi:hypothetical protein
MLGIEPMAPNSHVRYKIEISRKFSPTHQKQIDPPKGSLVLINKVIIHKIGIISCIKVPPKEVIKSPKKAKIRWPASWNIKLTKCRIPQPASGSLNASNVKVITLMV